MVKNMLINENNMLVLASILNFSFVMYSELDQIHCVINWLQCLDYCMFLEGHAFLLFLSLIKLIL